MTRNKDPVTKHYSEDQVEAHLIQKCKKMHVFYLKNTGMNAIPDRLLLYKGIYLWVELKATGEKMRPDQESRARQLRKHGAEVVMADSYKTVEEVLKYLIQKGDQNESNQSKRKTGKT